MKHDHHTSYIAVDTISTGETESLVWKHYQSRAVAIQGLVLIGLAFTAWNIAHAFFPQSAPDTIHFLDVGQGDAALITLSAPTPHQPPVRILIDGGRDGRAREALSALEGEPFRYIDLVILSHQDLDHFGGLMQVLDQYDVGAFISNGKEADSDRWQELIARIEAKNIPHHTLSEGDRVSFADNTFSVLSPTKELRATATTNEAGLVLSLTSVHPTGTTTILFTGDIGHHTEHLLLANDLPLKADILKVGHHGSKYSSSEAFIHAIAPSISIISVGKNTYGHPAPDVLDILTRAGSAIYTTETHATIRVPLDPSAETPPKKSTRGFLAAAFFGLKNQDPATEVTLQEAREEQKDMTLVPVTTCTFDNPQGTASSPVRINEVAWMGTATEATHEWIELLRTGDTPVDISGWQILNESGRVHATFPQGTLLSRPFAVAARTNADTALSLSAETRFTGSLRNTNEGIQLFTNDCFLVDEIPVSATWAAGNNTTKQTMERLSHDTWVTSRLAGGSPRAHTSGVLQSEAEEPTEPKHGETKTDMPEVSAEFVQNKDGTFHVTIHAQHVASTTHDVKVALESEEAVLSETLEPLTELWRSSLYYLPAHFSGSSYDETLHLRLRPTHQQFSGNAALVVRIRESGKSHYREYVQEVAIAPVPYTIQEKPSSEKSKPTVKKVTVPAPTIDASYPATITVGEPFTITLDARNFSPETYDVKVSVEHERVLSRTKRADDTWASSQFYTASVFTGPAATFSLSLAVPTSTDPLPEAAEILVRARKSGGSGFIYFQGLISLEQLVIEIPETSPEAEPEPLPENPEEIPEEAENVEETQPEEPEIPEPANSCVNINTATLEELDTLQGIGPALAERIIAERESERGLFASIDDLIRVSGIGPSVLANILAQGTVCM